MTAWVYGGWANSNGLERCEVSKLFREVACIVDVAQHVSCTSGHLGEDLIIGWRSV